MSRQCGRCGWMDASERKRGGSIVITTKEKGDLGAVPRAGVHDGTVRALVRLGEGLVLCQRPVHSRRICREGSGKESVSARQEQGQVWGRDARGAGGAGLGGPVGWRGAAREDAVWSRRMGATTEEALGGGPDATKQMLLLST